MKPIGRGRQGEKINKSEKRKKHERLQPCYSRRGSNVPDNDYEYKYVKSSALYFFSPPSVYLLLDRSLRPTLVPPSCASSAFLSLSLGPGLIIYLRPPCWIMFIIGARTFSFSFFLHHPTTHTHTHTHTLVGIFWKWGCRNFSAMKVVFFSLLP